jgi:hypothetical protein
MFYGTSNNIAVTEVAKKWIFDYFESMQKFETLLIEYNLYDFLLTCLRWIIW